MSRMSVAAVLCVCVCAIGAAASQPPGTALEQKQRHAGQREEAPGVARGPGVPINDECLGATTLSCGESFAALIDIGSTGGGDPEFSCAFGGPRMGSGSVWFRYVAVTPRATITTSYPNPTLPNGSSPDTLLAVFSGTCGSLTSIACNDDIDLSGNNFLSSVTIDNLVVGEAYIIEVAAYSAASRATYGVTISGCVAPNDECAGAIEAACGTSVGFDLRLGTTHPGDPMFACRSDSACNPGGAPSQGAGSLWFRFVSRGTHATITTSDGDGTDSAADTLLAVYAGVCGSLVQIACNDDVDCPNVLFSSVELSGLIADQAYYIEVAGWNAAALGPTALAVDCFTPADECMNPVELACDQVVEADLRYTTTDPSDPVFSCRTVRDSCDRGGGPPQGVNSMWFRFTTSSPRAIITTVDLDGGSSQDTLLAVYDGDCGMLAPVACNDDIDCATNLLSRIVLNGLTIGHEYLVEVAASDPSAVGLYGVRLECRCGFDCPPVATPEPESCGGDVNSGCYQGSAGNTPVALGEVICGTAPNVTATDVDVYSFTCTRPTNVQWVTLSESDTLPALLSAGCPGGALIAGPVSSCEMSRIAAYLVPGGYAGGMATTGIALCGTDAPNYLACVAIAPLCPGDANGDGLVSFADITAVLTFFNRDYNPFPGVGEGDANSSGVVNFADVTSVLENFASACGGLLRTDFPADQPESGPWGRP